MSAVCTFFWGPLYKWIFFNRRRRRRRRKNLFNIRGSSSG